ncbi:MAG: FGGY family carbohydrate kinase [Asticcacaulis sp.]|nr:FGGY family carbohydrate kinase [Asticcacaulis sp.]
MSRYVLALDQGTTSSRAIIVDGGGHILKIAQKEFRQIFPQGGWVEHDAREIWSTQMGVAQEALTAAGLRASDIAAIGITNQRETTVIWDRATGQPIHNAIVWQDRRTAAICDDLIREGHEPLFEAEDRPAPRCLFQRHQDQMAARSCTGGAGKGRTRRTGLRHH